MKQNIRNLFKQEVLQKKKLPDSHREGFLEKLTASKKKRKRITMLYKYAAIFSILFSIGFVVTNLFSKENNATDTALEIQLREIEKTYLENIDKEWQSFIVLTKDEKLIKRYEDKLGELNEGYQEISSQYKIDKNNMIVIEALIENLKTRLQLLQDIQQHINLLNKEHENTTI